MGFVLRTKPAVAGLLPVALTDETSAPIFVQIAAQIRSMINNGRLLPGARLPPVRDLARQLTVNPITVGRAYRTLVEEGLVEGRRGGGTRVAARGAVEERKPLTRGPDEPILAERLFELARAPGVIAFSSNYPGSDNENTAVLRTCLEDAVAHDLEACLHYEPPAGREGFRRQISLYLQSQSIDADEKQIVVTSGGQQALELAVRTLVPPGGTAVIERPAYYGVINVLRNIGARIIDVPVESDGLAVERLDAILAREKVKLVCVNPTFQNPTGATMSEEKRHALLALARKHGVAILEDDHSPEIRFRGNPEPPLRALAEAGEPVFYTRGFGKVFLPGMRLGCLVMPDAYRNALLHAKVQADMHCAGLLQVGVERYFAAGHHLAFASRIRQTYEPRQRLLAEGLRAGLPDEVELDQPDGGLSLWLRLPGHTDASELYYRAVRRGVAFVSGEVFHVSGAGASTMRISFGLTPPDALHEGVERLCSVVKDLMSRRTTRGLVLT